MRRTQLEITTPHNSTSWELFELKRSSHYISMIKSIPATFSAFVEHSGFCSLFRCFSLGFFSHTNDYNGGFLFTCKGFGVRFNKPFSTHVTPFACFFKSISICTPILHLHRDQSTVVQQADTTVDKHFLMI